MLVMALEYLQTLGRAKSAVSNIASSPMGNVAKQFTEDLIKHAKENLAPRNATGSLSASIIPDINIEGSIVTIEILAEDYWDFINSGVNGTQNAFGSPYSFASLAKTQSSGLTFQNSLQAWFATKGIIAEDGDYQSLAFVMMQSIKKNGIKPSHFMDDALTEAVIDKFENDLFEAYQSMF